VCKYTRHPGSPANRLLQEYLGSCLANYWGLKIPEFGFVNIKPDHAGNHSELQPIFFQAPCFGSLYNREYKEVDKFMDMMVKADKKKFANRHDFLKIALFDIWTSNEDRNHNNFNLLIHSTDTGYYFIPIDHEMIFNTGNLDKGLCLITDSESIISTPITKKLFTRKELTDQKYLESIKKEYYLCTSNCKKKLNGILQEIPDEWLINKPVIKQSLLDNLFQKKWIEDCFKEFLCFIQLINQ